MTTVEIFERPTVDELRCNVCDVTFEFGADPNLAIRRHRASPWHRFKIQGLRKDGHDVTEHFVTYHTTVNA